MVITLQQTIDFKWLFFFRATFLFLLFFEGVDGFSASTKSVDVKSWLLSVGNQNDGIVPRIESIEDASLLLQEWDKFYSTPASSTEPLFTTPQETQLRQYLPQAVRFLSEQAANERNQDSTKGRCMLGICASSLEEGIFTLKSWVTTLQLPRGLLHGADVDGVQMKLDGGVYIKYNSGGVYTFADIRKSGLGFDALWKPGDALMEPYDGSYRGVYFQVELSDGEFRQYQVPLDTFVLES
jgi:hypothetical protein